MEIDIKQFCDVSTMIYWKIEGGQVLKNELQLRGVGDKEIVFFGYRGTKKLFSLLLLKKAYRFRVKC